MDHLDQTSTMPENQTFPDPPDKTKSDSGDESPLEPQQQSRLVNSNAEPVVQSTSDPIDESDSNLSPKSSLTALFRGVLSFFQREDVTKWSITITTLLGCCAYVFDVVTDAMLTAYIYRYSVKLLAFIMMGFIILPPVGFVVLTIFRCCRGRATRRESALLAIVSLLGLTPLYFKAVGLKKLWKGEGVTSVESAFKLSSAYRFFEAFFESFPQLWLQIFLFTLNGEFIPLQLLSILGSLLSVSLGLVDGFLSLLGLEPPFPRPLLAVWSMLQTTAILPPIILFSSSSSTFAFFFLTFYLAIHLGVSTTALTAKFASKTRARRVVFGGILVLLQVAFLIVCNLLSARWFVSIASDLGGVNEALVPSFAWPDPPSSLKGWMINHYRNPGCRSSIPVCVDDHADVFFLFFFVLSLVAFVYAVAVIVFRFAVKKETGCDDSVERGDEERKEVTPRLNSKDLVAEDVDVAGDRESIERQNEGKTKDVTGRVGSA